jgi:hypothetical protein
MESGNPLLDDYVLGLCKAERPRVCFLPSASGDADHYIVRFYRAFPAERCEPSHISLFRRERGPEDIRSHLLSQDLIYVGGGSVVSLLGAWRAHGIDDPPRSLGSGDRSLRALAGSLCWFAEAVTGFHTAPRNGRGDWPDSVQQLRPLRPEVRRAGYHEFLREGCAPATRPRTARLSTSARSSVVWWRHGRSRADTGSTPTASGRRDADRDSLPRRRDASRSAPVRSDVDRDRHYRCILDPRSSPSAATSSLAPGDRGRLPS